MARLGDVCFKITDGSHNPPQGVPASEYLMLSSKNIFDDVITFDDPRYLSKEDFELENKRTQIATGDILMTIVGTVGRAAVVPDLAHNICLQRSVAVLKPKSEIVLPRFLMYQLQSMRTKLEKEAKGVAQKGIYLKQVEDLPIRVLSMDEQTGIVSSLDKVSNLLSLRKQQLAKLDELVKSQFVEMFGDPFDNPKWDTQRLRNLSISISDGSNIDKAYYKEKGDVLFLRIQNVWFNEFRLDDSAYISEDVNNEHLDTSLHHGDLLITKIGRYYTKDSSLGRVSVYLGEDNKANYSNNIMRVRLTDKVCSEFVNVLMNLDDYNRYIREVSVGGTDKRALSKAVIGDLPIIIPPKELQIDFLEFVKQTDKSKLAIQQSIEKLETLKKSLMQQYFG